MKTDKKSRFKFLFDFKLYVAIIFVISVITLISGNVYLAVAELFIIAGLIVAFVFDRVSREQKISKYLKHINNYIDSSAKGYMYNFPLPITVLDLTGTVIWCNEKFSAIYGAEVIECPISEIAREIQILKILEDKDNILFDVNKNGEHYRVVGNIVETGEPKEKEYSVVLYWINKTDEIKNYEYAINSKVVVCNILVDNYDELLKNTPDTERSILVSEIDRVIESWVDSLNGVYKKYEKDRYNVYFENEKLKRVIDSKFSILDTVKDIDMGNKIAATLSIAVGIGEGIRQSEEYVGAAMDMALGRGGDQAVIKDVEQFRFFGGHSESYGKNTRVRARVVANALRELLDQCDNVFVFGHKNADADCFGAAVAVVSLAKQRNKQAYVVIDRVQSGIEKTIESLKADSSYEDVFISESAALSLVEKNSICVVVDTHNAKIIEAPKLFEQVRHHVLIDHHRRGTDYIEDCVLTYHEPYASSTCELMTEIIEYMSEEQTLTSAEAQAIYAGMVLDTKNFNIKTGVRTFEAAAFLRRKGVDTVEVKKLFQSNIDSYVKKAKIVANTKIYRKYFAVSIWNEAEEYPTVIASQAADELLNIADVKASFVLCVQDDEIFISARSLGAYNVQLVMEQMGGGGHMTVAGAQIKGKQLSEVEELLKKAIDNVE